MNEENLNSNDNNVKSLMRDYFYNKMEDCNNDSSSIEKDIYKQLCYTVNEFCNKPYYTKTAKQIKKQEVKEKVKTKYVVGDIYSLSIKSRDNSKSIRKTFELKKFIYTINEEEVNILIMKQLSGPTSMMFTLNKEDCKKYHIKYEEGLQVFSMYSKFVKLNKKK
mgnify:CR=1 FL=1